MRGGALSPPTHDDINIYILLTVQLSIADFPLQTKEAGVYNFINPSTISVMQRADKKLSFIPVVFILLRLWGTVQLFYAIGRTHNIYYGCTVYADWIGFQFFSYTQV